MRILIVLAVICGLGYYFLTNGGREIINTAKNNVQTSVTATINTEIQENIIQVKEWLYNSLSPILPWFFIIFLGHDKLR